MCEDKASLHYKGKLVEKFSEVLNTVFGIKKYRQLLGETT